MVVGHEVSLGQHQDRPNARFAGQHEISLETRDIEVLVARSHDEKRIDVGRDKLKSPFIGGSGPFEEACAIENASNA
jgi:hypothetical protein